MSSFQFEVDLQQLIKNKPFYLQLLGSPNDNYYKSAVPPWIVTVPKKGHQVYILSFASVILVLNLFSIISYWHYGRRCRKYIFMTILHIANIILCSFLLHWIATSKFYKTPQQTLFFAHNNAEKLNAKEIDEYLHYRSTILTFAIPIIIIQLILALDILTGTDQTLIPLDLVSKLFAAIFSGALIWLARVSELDLRTQEI